METSFLLKYGIEAIILVEIGCLSPRVTYYSPKHNEKGLRTNHNLLEESRLTVLVRR